MHLPEVQHLEDPDNETDEPTTRPLGMALRNSAAALLGIGLMAFGYWLEFHEGPIWWWLWLAAAGFAVVVCFTHAFLASLIGGRAAGAALKCAAVLVLAAILVFVWWSLQPKPGAH